MSKHDTKYSWQRIFDENILSFLTDENATLDELVRIIIEIGILDRVAPLDESEMESRKRRNALCWTEGRDSPSLWWSVTYSANEWVATIKQCLSINQNFVQAIMSKALYKLLDNKKLMQRILGSKDYDKAAKALAEAVINASNERLKQLGHAVPESLFTVGQTILINGHVYLFERLDDLGRFCLRAEDREGLDYHYSISKGNPICPIWIHQHAILA